MFSTYMETWPWDVLDEAADAVLDEIAHEIGLTGVSLWASWMPTLQVRARPGLPPLVRSRGGAAFPLAGAARRLTRCRVAVTPRVRSGDLPEVVSRACVQRNLRLRFVLSAARVGRVARRRDFAVVNALGDGSRINLCLVDGDVQGLLVAQVGELNRRYQPDGLVLAHLQQGWAEALEPDSALRQTSVSVRRLLSVCFCPSCHQEARRAGVDAHAAREQTVALIEQRLAGETDAEARDDLPPESPLGQYRTVQVRAVERLLADLRAASSNRLVIRLDGHELEEILLRALAHGTDYGTILHTGAGHLDDRLGAEGGERSRRELCLDLGNPRSDDATLVGEVAALAKRGYSAVTFSSSGLLSRGERAALAKAVRFARREGNAG